MENWLDISDDGILVTPQEALKWWEHINDIGIIPNVVALSTMRELIKLLKVHEKE